jgi:uncharacterized protein (TIGR02147 family)
MALTERPEDYRDILRFAFYQRLKANPKYSLRAFARGIQLPASTLSEILNAKRGISRKRGQEIAERLGFSAEKTKIFCDLIEAAHGRSPAKKVAAKKALAEATPVNTYHYVLNDSFSLIADWYHFAILELLQIPGVKPAPAAIADTLSISRREAADALERLLRLGLLRNTMLGYEPANESNATSNDVPSEAIRSFHLQILQKAIAALAFSVEQREISSSILAFDPSDIAAAKQMIRQFRRNFSKKFGKKIVRSEVFALCTQFFPLTESRRTL